MAPVSIYYELTMTARGWQNFRSGNLNLSGIDQLRTPVHVINVNV